MLARAKADLDVAFGLDDKLHLIVWLVLPSGDARALVAGVHAAAPEAIVLVVAAAAAPAGVFVSPRVPTMIVQRMGAVVAQAIGHLPAHELRGLLARR